MKGTHYNHANYPPLSHIDVFKSFAVDLAEKKKKKENVNVSLFLKRVNLMIELVRRKASLVVDLLLKASL